MYHRMFEMGDEKDAMLLQGLFMCSIPYMLAAYPYPCACMCVRDTVADVCPWAKAKNYHNEQNTNGAFVRLLSSASLTNLPVITIRL